MEINKRKFRKMLVIFLEFLISVRRGLCYCSSWTYKNLATVLVHAKPTLT